MFSIRLQVQWFISFILCVAAQDAVPVRSPPNSGVNVVGVIAGVIVGMAVAYVAVMVIYCMWCKKRNKMDVEKGDKAETDKKQSAKLNFALPLKSKLKMFNSSHNTDNHGSKDSQETRLENVYDQVGDKESVKAKSVGIALKKKLLPDRRENEELPSYSSFAVGADQEQIDNVYNDDDAKLERQQINRGAGLAQAEDELHADDEVRMQVYRREDRAEQRRNRNNAAVALSNTMDGVFI